MPTTLPDQMRLWLAEHINLSAFTIESILPEASTRSFWRLRSPISSLIGMLSPPASENNQQFCLLSDIFRTHQVPVPEVYAKDLKHGYLLVSDVGDKEIKSVYSTSKREAVLSLAIDTLLQIQQVQSEHITPYTTNRLHMELGIFREWVCNRLLQIQTSVFDATADTLVDAIDSQPKLTVHRDFHCRNLLQREPDGIGVVDFQDALVGPCTYDLASLLYDCYYQFDDVEIQQLQSQYFNRARQQNIATMSSLNELRVATEHCALQRQLKAVGIFCRLATLQGKTSHLCYVESVLNQVVFLCSRYSEFKDLGNWLNDEVIPQMPAHLLDLEHSDVKK